MLFRRALQRYGSTPPPETPYQRAGQAWDERIGSARVQAANWRLIAFGSLAISGAMSGGLIWQSMQSRVVPYVVEVDRLGEARAVEPAVRDVHPTDPQLAWFLSHFIANVRARSLDPVLMRDSWLAAYDFTTKRGSAFLSEYARTADPFANVGERTVSVQVTSVVRASDKSFQVKWLETAYVHGTRADISHWTAIVTIVMAPPPNAEVLRKNPLGIYVDAIDWSRELEPQGSNATSPVPARQSADPTAPPAVAGAPALPSLAPPVTNEEQNP